MKRKLLVSALSLTLVVTSSGVVFAGETIDGQQIIAEHQANVVEDVVGTEDVCTDIEESRKEFSVEGETLDVEIPKDGDEAIVMESEDGEEIAMELPEEAKKSDAVLTDDGTIVYDTREDVSVAVQAIEEEQDGVIFEAVRTMVTIENENAPQEYEFKFDLPRGYELIMDTDYYDELDEYDCGAVYVINNQNEIINTIDEPWALDANGNDIETYYMIRENILVQYVEFDENTAFPVVADPVSRPTITKYNCYTIPRGNKHVAVQARNKINQRQNNTLSRFCSVMTSLIGFMPYVNTAVGYTMSSIGAVQGGVNSNLEHQEDIYEKIIEVYQSDNRNYKKASRAIITYPLKGTWKGNSRGYVYTQQREYVIFYSAAGAKLNI